MDFYKVILVGLGGFLGSIARYITVRTIDQKVASIFPYGTLTVNIVGSFLFGLIYALALKKLGASENERLFWGAGFCGGFTTFSAFAWENLNLITQKNLTLAGVYIVGSLAVGITAVLLGIWTVRNL